MYRNNIQWTLSGRMTPLVKALIILNSFVFIIQMIFHKWLGIDLTTMFGLSPLDVLSKGYLWQCVTYLFLHGHLMHLVFNMLVLWMLGGEIEERVFKAVGFLKYYFICGIGAAVFNVIISYQSDIPIIGSSGAIYGILAAYAIFFGNRQLVLFPFPVLIPAKYLIIMIGVIELVSSIFYTKDGIAHVAHLGGMVAGFLYIRYKIKGPPAWFRRKKKFVVIQGKDYFT